MCKTTLTQKLDDWKYLGYDKATLAQYEAQIAQNNLKIFAGALVVTVITTLAELAFILLFAGSGEGVTGSLLKTANLLLITLALIAVMAAAYLAVRKKPNKVRYSRAFTTVFLSLWSILYIIISTSINPEDYAVIACGLFLIIQVLFDAYPMENLIFVSCVYVLFAIMEIANKQTMILVYDLIDALPFLLVGLFLSWIKARSKWSSLINADAMVKLETQKLENELLQSRMAVMLSQIQPHFLYNALSSIQCLCHDDPAMAERVTGNFSRFLRGNMDSLTMDKPIWFERELEHTKYYLDIEAVRFPDKLKVTYDIEATLFRLPTLTLQPIVENAVRYGVTKRRTGGTVTISTRETDAAFTVTVTDDGVGFDPMLPHEDGRTHVGIQNVKDRLARMSGGTLEIESTPGVGTVAVITIPKEAKL